MSINVECPGCGARRSLPDAFRGVEVTCPRCGNRFVAEASSAGSADAIPLLTTTGSAAESGAGPAPADERAVPAAKLAQRVEPLPGLPPLEREDFPLPAEPKPAVPLPAGSSLAGVDQAGPERLQYKVLTRKNLWFTGALNPEGLEEALNSYAQQGWRLKSTFVMTVPDAGKSREELVVILER